MPKRQHVIWARQLAAAASFAQTCGASEAGAAFGALDVSVAMHAMVHPVIHSQPLRSTLNNTRVAMASGGYAPAAYRDSEDGEARCVQGPRESTPRRAHQDATAQSPAGVAESTDMRPARLCRPLAAPSFDWSPAPPPARTAAASPAPCQVQQRLAAAAALVKKCVDLGLPRPPLPHAQPPQPPPARASQQQAATVGQLAAATSQLQRQSGALVAALESQSAQLAAQQRLLQDVLQGMLFMAVKSAAHASAPPTAPAALAAAATAAAAPGGSAPAPVPPQQQPAACPPAAPVCQGSKPSLLLQDLANILAAQQAQQLGGRAAQPVPQIRPLVAGVQAAQAPPACMAAAGLHPVPPAAPLARCQPVPGPSSTGYGTPRLTRTAQLRLNNAQLRPLGEPELEADGAATACTSWQRPGRPKPEWDGRTVVPEPPRGSRPPRLNDPVHHRQRPRGISASLAAQLLEQVRSGGAGLATARAAARCWHCSAAGVLLTPVLRSCMPAAAGAGQVPSEATAPRQSATTAAAAALEAQAGGSTSRAPRRAVHPPVQGRASSHSRAAG